MPDESPIFLGPDMSGEHHARSDLYLTAFGTLFAVWAKLVFSA